mgnify:CR=1 FL=1
MTGADLVDVVSDGADVWAVGNLPACTDACGVLIGRQNGAWVVEQPLQGKPLAGIARLGAGELLVVAQTGQAARRKDGKWTSEATGSELPLASVSAAAGEAFAVGGFCAVLHRKADGTWEAENVDGCASDLGRVLALGPGVAGFEPGEEVLLYPAIGWGLHEDRPDPGFEIFGVPRHFSNRASVDELICPIDIDREAQTDLHG